MFDKTRAEQIKALKPYFPKVNKSIYSIASRPDETGVTWITEARRIISGLQPVRIEHRSCPCRYSVRLTEAISREFNRCRGALSVQDALTEAVLMYIADKAECAITP